MHIYVTDIFFQFYIPLNMHLIMVYWFWKKKKDNINNIPCLYPAGIPVNGIPVHNTGFFTPIFLWDLQGLRIHNYISHYHAHILFTSSLPDIIESRSAARIDTRLHFSCILGLLHPQHVNYILDEVLQSNSVKPNWGL